MHQGFAPGRTAWEVTMREVFNRRKDTRASPMISNENIEDFFRDLRRSNVVADDLLVGSHASNEGILFLDLDAVHSGQVSTFEVLEEVAAGDTLEIPVGIKKPTTRFHVKGCRIGADECRPYLTLLKRALGNKTPVTAPRFFHGFFRGGLGHFEWMGHSYEVKSKDAIGRRDDLVKAFQQAQLTRLDGTPVDAAEIDRWVRRELNLSPPAQHVVPLPVPVLIVPRTGNLSAIDNVGSQCRSEREIYTFQGPGVETQAKLKTALQAIRMFEPTHPFPFFKRQRFATFDEWFNGKNWVFNRRTNTWLGTHFVYTLVIPVTKPAKPPAATNELIFNFYPPTGDPTMFFHEDNAAFNLFGQV
jgi:hypothetical protein